MNPISWIRSLFNGNSMVGKSYTWTRDSATNSKVAREILRMVVYTCVLSMVGTLMGIFVLIMVDKLDATAGTVMGGIFTLLGGILAVTLPAFVSALNANDPNINTPPTTPPISGQAP